MPRNLIRMSLSLCALPCMGFDASAATSATLTPYALRCENTSEARAVDVARPSLGWRLRSDRRGDRQTAWQILVSETPEALAADRGDLWDSGRVVSSDTLGIAYDGVPLKAWQTVFWKVRVWDTDERVSPWSEPARWTMGALSDEDWSQARWLTGPMVEHWPDSGLPADDPRTDSLVFRRDFVVKPGLVRATLALTGLGHYCLSANGEPVGDTFLDPGWTTYAKTVLYTTHDLTPRLRVGANTLGVMLGNGFFNKHRVIPGRYDKSNFDPRFEAPRLIAVAELLYADGSRERFVSDPDWLVAPGPITFSHIYGGEDYDARRLPTAWDQPAGANINSWQPATPIDGPGGALRGLSVGAPPLRYFETLPPVSAKEIRPGVTVYDLGQNAALALRLRVRGPAGAIVRVEPAELVHADGSIDVTNIRNTGQPDERAWWQYTLRGDPAGETYDARFFYQGGRYLQVERLSPPGAGTLPSVELIEGRLVQADAPAVGAFACANPLFNRIHALIRWAQRSNLMSVLTDCPTREKLGWLEQYHLNGPALHYNFDLSLLGRKLLQDMRDVQQPSGLVTTTAPTYARFRIPSFYESPEWGSSSVIVPEQLYLFYGDARSFSDNLDLMRGYTRYLDSRARDGIVDHGLGDWFDLGPKPPDRAQLTSPANTGTAYLYLNHRIVAHAARILGDREEAAVHERLAEDIRATYNTKLFNAAAGRYGNDPAYPVGSQCATALPLVLDLAPPERRGALAAALAKSVLTRGNTAGDVGYRYVLRALADAGRSDVIYQINHQSEKPGYGLQLARGATALTEAWDAAPHASQNHFMLGQLNEWLFHDLAGIQPDPDRPGFAGIIIRPAIVGDLAWAEASYHSVRGLIRSRWERSTDGRLTLDLTVPPNTEATVHLPTTDPEAVRLDGQPIAHATDVRRVRVEPRLAVYAIPSGHFRFSAPWPAPASP